MEIKRDKYLNDLIIRMHNGMVKVITGVRRCGKSYLVFNLFRDYLLANGVGEDHIIALDLENRHNSEFRDPDRILDYIEAKIVDRRDYYVMLDEVQMLSNFEEVLNTLMKIGNVDVYVTGSNSKFLSKDVITEFRGRGDEVRIHPLSFKEFMQSYEGDVYHGWTEYITYGGLPFLRTVKTEEQKIRYLDALFVETYIRDIVERNRVEKKQELGDLINVLASSVGSLSNPGKIEATFHSRIHSTISQNTIREYIEYLKDAFLISEAHRYDVKGRKYIGSPVKYYFEDVGLRNARIDFRQTEETHLMENVIYNELVARGFNVDVGVVPTREVSDGKYLRKQLEVDFVANLGSRRYYVQSAYAIPDEAKARAEKASLLKIPDSFKKIVVVKDVMKVTRDEMGITSMGLFDFLLREDSLDL